MMDQRTIGLSAAITFCFFAMVSFAAAQAHLSTAADYHKYIDPLLQVKDFGTEYYDDGAADATVLFPSTEKNPYQRPVDPVLSIFRLHSKSFPLLIDCLTDVRITNMKFDGNNITKEMRVPVGYVCLDILMQMTLGEPVSDPECSDDGLGACMNDGYYFRPNDYGNCWETECELRPWVKVVQRNWRKQFLAGRLRFFNPYNVMKLEEFKDLQTPSGPKTRK